MKILTIRDFRTRPKQAQKTLATEGEAILTSNGKPVALMVGVDGDSLDEAIQTLHRARGLRALRMLRREARKSGVNTLGNKGVERLVKKARRERQRIS